MLAVTAFLGINFAAKAIGNTGSEFYKSSNFRDIQVISTKLLSTEDIEALRAVQGVADVEGVFRTEGKIFTGDNATEVAVLSLTNRINKVQVVEGRLPSSADECVLEKTVDDDTGLKIGDKVNVTDSKGNTPDYLLKSEYVITGIVYHPDHSCWPVYTPGVRYVLLQPDAFDKEALDNCFMTAEVIVDGTQGMNVFNQKYLDKVGETVKRIEAISEERANIRFNYIKGRYEQGIVDGKGKLIDARKQLDDARAELDKNWKDYNDGVKQLEEAKKTIEDNEKKLSDAEKQLSSGKIKLDEAKKQLDKGKTQLNAAEKKLNSAHKELDSTYKKLESSKKTIRNKLKSSVTSVLGEKIANKIDWSESNAKINVDNPNVSATKLQITKGITIDLKKSMSSNIFRIVSSLGIPEKDLKEAYEKTTGKILKVSEGSTVLKTIVNIITKQYNKINVKYNTLASAAKKWDAGHKTYISKLNEYKKAESKYKDGLNAYKKSEDTYNSGLSQYNKGKAELERGKKDYEDAKKKLEDALAALNEGEEKYKTGLADYEKGKADLQGAIDEMELLDACRWFLLDVNGSTGYAMINTCRQNCEDLGTTFALIFILVGALVIYATVGRIVDEQRRLVGANKALGLFNREILMKYLVFGVSGTVFGMISGTLLGYFAVQTLVLSIYGRNFIYGAGSGFMDVPLTVIVFAGGLFLSGITVWFACTSLLKSSAITLMQETVPGVKKKKGSEKKNKTGKGSLYGRLILLNMLTDKKRVAVTIASIAGCCSLLVSGLTMNFAVNKTIDEEYTSIEVFGMKIKYDSTINENADAEIEKVLKDNGVSFVPISDRVVSYNAGGKISATELLCGDLTDMNSYFVRRDPQNGTPISETGEGIWIHVKTASLNDLTSGSQITLYDSVMNPYQVAVSGIFSIRFGPYAIMDRKAYQNTYGTEPENNAYLVLLNGADAKKVSDGLSGIKGIMEVADTQERYEETKNLAAVLVYLAILFIAIAGMMAYFILLNLVNMYINQKKKELTIMRINGFTVKETIRYVSLELIVSTLIGIFIGLLTGSLLGYKILTLIEGPDFCIIKTIQFEAWGIATAITIFFTALVSAWALRKVKYLKLTDVA